MFTGIFIFVFKAFWAIFKVILVIAFVIFGFITAGAFIAAIFKLFPVAGIILAIILVSVAAYYIAFYVRKRKARAIHESPEKSE